MTLLVCVIYTGVVLEFLPAALDQDIAWLIGITIGGFLLIAIAWFMIIDSYASQRSDNIGLQSELQLRNAEQNQMETLQVMYEHLQGLRHDFSNQMLGLKGYVAQKDWKGLEEHLDILQTGVERDIHEVLTGLPQLDMMLSVKLKHAEKLSIKTTSHYVVPSVLGVNPVDLCSIVGNIVDNAIEAQENLPEGERYMKLSFEPVESMWCIRLENAGDGQYRREGEGFLSTKGGSGRGIGLRRIKTLIEENGGFHFITPTDRSFSIEIYLPWKPNGQNKRELIRDI
jgi:sensor histidine kinase regulating citrate/malate metabolism